MPSEPQLVELHAQMLILLKKFHELCTEADIKYSLHGGTLIGAVREKGFIPWDDDTDISITRAEYEKLRKVMEKGNKYGLVLSDCERIVRVSLENEVDSVCWIDLFIWDYISENTLAQKCKIFGEMILGSFLKTRKGLDITKEKVGTKYSKMKYGLFYLGYCFGHLFPKPWKLKWFHSFCKRRFCGSKTLMHRSNDQYTELYLIMPAEVMSGYKLVSFEDTQLMVSENYHELLVSSYGDSYMIPQRPDEWDIKVHDLTRASKNI